MSSSTAMPSTGIRISITVQVAAPAISEQECYTRYCKRRLIET